MTYATGMPIQFKFPIRSMQLCEQPSEPNIFYVSDRINVGQWKEEDQIDLLTKCFDQMTADRQKSLRILTNEVFDPIYSIIFHLDNVSISVRKEVLLTLQTGLQRLLSLMNGTKVLDWANQNFLSSSTIAQLIREDPQCKMAIQIQNALSAYIYLITWFL